MATIIHSPRLPIPQLHSQEFSFSYPRSFSITPSPPTRFPFAAPHALIRRRLNLVQSECSVTSPGTRAVAEPAVSAEEADDEVDPAAEVCDGNDEADPTAEVCFLDPDVDQTVGIITDWELDFCSRPILDERGKKVWELVVCDSSLSLQYTRYFPNNVINSITLRDAIASIAQDLGVPLPERIRFFRSQMQTIITKACNELGIKPVPSKRCISLLLWLEERYENVYTRHPGFQKGAKPFLALDNPFPMELPENLSGEKWAFVQLPYSAVKQEISSLARRQSFGGTLDLDLLGLEIDDKTLIPGVAVASSRAKPLAAWMNGLEVASMEADTSRACLILSAGVATRYVYATYKKTSVTTQEAESWEAAKKACGGLHFLAIQESLDSDDCVGFWLLLDLPPPPV